MIVANSWQELFTKCAADNASSHSGKVSLGILFPKMIALGVRISDMGLTDAQDFFKNRSILKRGMS